MTASLTLDALDAFDGDAILLVCRSCSTFSVLVDGGRAATAPLLREKLIEIGHLDLLVVSHIDGDHIEGIVELLSGDLPVTIGEIWFNGLEHIVGNSTTPGFSDLAPADGVRLTEAIARAGIPWNTSFGGDAVCVARPGDVARAKFGEVTLSVVSPDRRRLGALAVNAHKWRVPDEEEEPGGSFQALSGSSPPDIPTLARQSDRNDTSGPNGSSIAFLVEFRDWRVLLCADAHPRLLSAGLRGLGATPEEPFKIDLVKVSHHGSRANTTRELLHLIDCQTFIISGPVPGRPHDETIAKIVSRAGPVALVFNRQCESLDRWKNDDLMRLHGYDASIQPPGGIRILDELPDS